MLTIYFRDRGLGLLSRRLFRGDVTRPQTPPLPKKPSGFAPASGVPQNPSRIYATGTVSLTWNNYSMSVVPCKNSK